MSCRFPVTKLVCGLAACASTAAPAATLDVHVVGIETSDGQILVALCSREETVDAGCRHVASASARKGQVQLRLEGLEPGSYALRVLHDLDGDRVLKKGRFGMPAEPIGFGNDAHPRFGAPSFEQAAIRVNADRTEVTVRLRHK